MLASKARIAVTGVGFIGEVHVRALQASGKAEVVAISDLNQERLTSLQNAYHIPRTYLDYEEMLKAEQLDGVVVATPEDLHRAPVEAVAAAGRHLLLEKPVATTMADAEAIVAAVQKSGIQCVMGFSLRFSPDYAAIKHKVDSGDLGIPRTAYMQRAITVDKARRLRGRCSVNQYLAVHDVDFVLWVFGSELESVYTLASHSRVFDELNTADHYWNLLRWKNGATASILATWGMPQAHPIGVETQAFLIGSRGSAQLSQSPMGRHVTFLTDENYAMPAVSGLPMYVSEAGHFADVALGKAEPLATVYDGLNASKVIDAGEMSLRSGAAVQISL